MSRVQANWVLVGEFQCVHRRVPAQFASFCGSSVRWAAHFSGRDLFGGDVRRNGAMRRSERSAGDGNTLCHAILLCASGDLQPLCGVVSVTTVCGTVCAEFFFFFFFFFFFLRFRIVIVRVCAAGVQLVVAGAR